MAISLPYLSSNKNLGTLFEKIASAKVPDKFVQDFLQQTIGLKGSNDRPIIPLLRTLGFLDQSGTPTASYRLLKSDEKRKPAIAASIRKAYAPLFAADEKAHLLAGDKLKSLIAQVAGTDDDMTARIASTFSTLVKLADFTTELDDPDQSKRRKESDDADPDPDPDASKSRDGSNSGKPLRPEFHYNIQIHLPSNGTEEIYLNIFNALRKTFK